MKIGIVGSRGIVIDNLDKYINDECEEIVSGGAKGVDTCAAEYARKRGIRLIEFLPNYKKYGRGAPIIRNKQIVEYADKIIAIWDGKSKGTQSTINYCKELNKDCQIVIINNQD